MMDLAVETTTRWQHFDNLPIGLFGAVMGLTGLGLAWHLAHASFGVPVWIAEVIDATAIAAFVALLIGYSIKLATAPQAVLAEFRHPIMGSLFGTFFVSLLLLPIVLAPFNLLLARLMWLLGAVGMLVFAWVIVNRWMSDRQQVLHATPAWIVPVVGLLDVPLATPALALPSVFTEGMYLTIVLTVAVGLFFAIPLFTLIFARLLFHPPMPQGLLPTLLILMAPFAIGFSSYTIATNEIDLFAQALYMLTLFMLAVLLPRIRHLPRCCPFRFSWWSVSFPLAAAAIASLRFATARPGWATHGVALVLLGLATTIIAGLFARTLMGIFRGELRTLSG